jgi:hypothetical protein
LPRRPTEVAIIRLFLECISSSALPGPRSSAYGKIFGVNASTAPDDNTPRVIKAHAVVWLLGYLRRRVRPKSVPIAAEQGILQNHKQFQLYMSQ